MEKQLRMNEVQLFPTIVDFILTILVDILVIAGHFQSVYVWVV